MDKPTSHTVAAIWARYEQRFLDDAMEDAVPGGRSLARASFYFGALGMLELLETVLAEAQSAASVECAIDAFRDEISGVIEIGATDKH